MSYTVTMKSHARKTSPATRKKKGAAVLAADAVKSARLRAGMTQTELAKSIGTGQRGILRLESGEHNTTIGSLERVAVATDSTLDIQLKPRR